LWQGFKQKIANGSADAYFIEIKVNAVCSQIRCRMSDCIKGLAGYVEDYLEGYSEAYSA
jgi:hypothetical protein